jgi:hypothetical protein
MPKPKALRDHFARLHERSPLDVGMLPDHRQEGARGAFNRRDLAAMAEEVPADLFWQFTRTNATRLRFAGMLEPWIAHGLIAGHPSDVACLIPHSVGMADPWILRPFGDPLPAGDAIAVYRGLADAYSWSQIKRVGWWLDPERAAHEALTKAYARHWFQATPTPTVLRLDVPRSDVQFIHDGAVWFRAWWKKSSHPQPVLPFPIARERPGAEPLAWEPDKCSVGRGDGGVVYAFGSDGQSKRFGSQPREVVA